MQGIQFVRSLCFAVLIVLGAAGAAANEAPPEEPTVNINHADAETLARMLDGVGMVRAEAIVRYREANGGFMTAEELANVTGIGLATVDRNQARIRLADD